LGMGSQVPWTYLRKGCIDYVQTTSPFLLIVVVFRGARDPLSLRICGFGPMVLWTA
jgi:hypothetical protein